MNSYRVIGARKDDGSLIDEILVANSPKEAEAQANGLGVLVSEIEFVESHSSPAPQAKGTSALKSVRKRKWERLDRSIIRTICTVNAVMLLIPGLLIFLFSIVSALILFIQRVGEGRGLDGAFEAALSAIGGGLLAIAAMLIGALLYMILFMEQWLWESRGYLARPQ